MLGKKNDESRSGTYTRTDSTIIEPRARGGVAFGPILTGVVVAFGAMFLLSALVGGILAAVGVIDPTITAGEVIEAGIGAGIALVIAQFLSYLWGGYTAGRMARGSGVVNGLLVPLSAVVVAILVGAVATGLGANANLNLPFTTNQLPLENGALVDWGVGIGIASLIAMFLGGALGGGMGAAWHTKLERTVGEEHAHRREVDLRDRDAAPTPSDTRTDHTATSQEGVDTSHDDRTHTSTLRR